MPVFVLAVALTAPIAASAQPAPPPSPPSTAPLPPPAASILVDVDTGAVLTGGNPRTPLPVASTTKIVTALVVRSRLADDTPVTVSPLAASMPARKLNLLPGERWRAGDLLQAMLLCSCNDAAVALAEASGGSIAGFGRLAESEAKRLGMVDHPVLQDPSGLDDEFSVGGGNLLSAHDLAVAARALLRDRELAAIVSSPRYEFQGGDGQAHVVVNHNRLLRLYPGAIGVKTGYTERAGSSLVAAARRNGRTMLAVVIDSPNTYAQVSAMLDFGFAVPASAQDDFPPLTPPTEPPPTTAAAAVDSGAAPDAGARSATPTAASGQGGGVPALVWVGVVVVVVALLVALRRRQVVRRRLRFDGDRSRT